MLHDTVIYFSVLLKPSNETSPKRQNTLGRVWRYDSYPLVLDGQHR